MPVTSEPAHIEVGGGLGALTQRVIHTEEKLTEIKGELRDLNVSIRELNSTIAAMGKPKWQVWSGISTLIVVVTGGVWGLAISPINDRVNKLETSYVSRDVHIEKWAQTKEDFQRVENEISQKASKDDINRLIIDIDQRLPKAKQK